MQPEITIKISFQGAEENRKVVIGEQREDSLGSGSEIKGDQNFEVPALEYIEETQPSFSQEEYAQNQALSVPVVSDELDLDISVPDVEEDFFTGASEAFMAPPQIEEEQMSSVIEGYDFTPPETPEGSESRFINYEIPPVVSELLTHEFVEASAEQVLYPNGNDGFDIPPLPEN